MNVTRAPLILVGQVYLNGDLNEYLIVTNNNRGQISYEGIGFKGQAEDVTFVERFEPVDPEDIELHEVQELIALCPEGTQPLVGYVPD